MPGNDSYLVTTGIKKEFEFLGHSFLLITSEKLGFGINFINWIKMFLNDKKLCVVNGSVARRYFKLEKFAQQGERLSIYFFYIMSRNSF